MISLDIFLDPTCPWCYIGKANLERALEANPQHLFQMVWHPFLLNPEIPDEGMERQDYLILKYGDQNKAIVAYKKIEELALEAGLKIDFSLQTHVPNTLHAHRLIHWAGIDGKQGMVVSALLRTYWQQGQDIGNKDVLAQIAGQCGLESKVILRLLQGDADIEEIQARDRHARQRGINCTPSFIVKNEYIVPGAQPISFWNNLVVELSEEHVLS